MKGPALGIPRSAGRTFVGEDGARLAAGILFVAPDGDVLLLRRSSTEKNYGGHWGLPGGCAEEGETADVAAKREFKEECGLDIDLEAGLKLMDRIATPNGMVFSTFSKPTEDKFVPVLDGEHTGYCWASIDQLPRPLHPSVEALLTENLGAAADMAPEQWQDLRKNFAQWTREEEREDEHAEDIQDGERVTLQLKDDDGQIKSLLGHIKRAAAGGHSFEVVVDPGDAEFERKFFIDGDGATKIMEMVHDEAIKIEGEVKLFRHTRPQLMALDRGSVRTYDADGRLRVGKTNLSKSNICPYWGHEIPGWQALGLDPSRKYQMFRHPDELARAAASSNGVPLLLGHTPVTPDDHKHEVVVGAIGSDAEWSDPFLQNSLIIWTREGIEAVESEEAKELSCGYRYDPDMTPGEFKGVPFDGVMRNIIFNHVALVPEGRAGADVVVGDSQIEGQGKEIIMTNKVLTRFGGASAVALAMYLQPRMAADAKIDTSGIFDGVTRKNFPEKKAKIAQDVKAAAKGKLAKDANIEDVTTLLDALEKCDVAEGADEDPNSGLPMNAAEMEKKAKDESEEKAKKEAADRAAKDAASRDFLKSKLSAEDLKAYDDMSGKVEDSEAEENAEGKEGAGEAKPVKDAVSKSAMDAALKSHGDTIRRQMTETSQAYQDVEPWVGKLALGMDSAEDVYRAALRGLGVSDVDKLHKDALKPVLNVQPKPGEKNRLVVQDARLGEGTGNFEKRWGDTAGRINA